MTSSAGDRNFDHEFLTLHEFIDAAREQLDENGWEYLVGGTETETTLKRNRAALDAVALRPRVLVDVSELDATGSFLSYDVRLPLMLAPVGGLETFDPEGAVAVARAADEFGVAVMSSSVSPRSKEEVRGATFGPAIFQLYVRGFGRFIEDEVEAAIEAGFNAFAFTVDTAVYSRRERDIVKRFDKPWRKYVNAESARAQASLSWADIERIRKTYDIPLILKGIGSVEDARMAVGHGIDMVYVSNHGGRQLDHGLGSAAVLPEIARAVAGQAQVIMDGAICRGTDVIKALALGADTVAIGRLYCYALAVGGSAGVVRALEILENEIHSAMGLLGVARLADLTPEHLSHGAPLVTEPGVLSAFPLTRA